MQLGKVEFDDGTWRTAFGCDASAATVPTSASTACQRRSRPARSANYATLTSLRASMALTLWANAFPKTFLPTDPSTPASHVSLDVSCPRER